MTNESRFTSTTDSGLYVPQSAQPTVKRGAKLLADIQSTAAKKSSFFWSIWGLLAVTTAYYGWENLNTLFFAFVSVFPFSPTNALIISQSLGAFMAVIFLDWGYMRWDYVKLNSTETAAQFNIANIAGIVAFAGSMFFTIAQIILAFEGVIPPHIVAFLQVSGVVVFVTSVSVTAIAKWAFERNSEETLRQASKAQTGGRSITEKLGIEGQAREAALIGARDDILSNLGPITAAIADGLRGEIVSGLIGEISDYQADTTDTDNYKKHIGAADSNNDFLIVRPEPAAPTLNGNTPH